MDQGNPDEPDYVGLANAIQRAGITLSALWLYYFSLGGAAEELEVDAYLHGLMPLQPVDRDLLALAVNEMYADL